MFSGNKATKPKKSKKKKRAEKKMNTKMLKSILPFTTAFIYANEDKGKKREPQNEDSKEANLSDSIEYEDEISDYEIDPAGNGRKSHQNQRQFNDVYGDIDQQYNAVKLFKKDIRRRKEYMEMTLMCQFTGTAVVFIHLFIYCMDLNKYN